MAMNLAGVPSAASTGSPYADHTGIVIDSVADGRCRAHLKTAKNITNTIGIFHGGALFTLADVAMGAAGWSKVYPKQITVTKTADIDYIRPGRAQKMLCDAQVVRQDGRRIYVQATLHDDGEIIAKANAVLVAIESPLESELKKD